MAQGLAGRRKHRDYVTLRNSIKAWLAKWKIDYGKLVVVDQKSSWSEFVKQGLKAQNLTDIPISDLPVGYQSVLASEKRGKTVAVTVPASDGSLLLGILPGLNLNNGWRLMKSLGND